MQPNPSLHLGLSGLHPTLVVLKIIGLSGLLPSHGFMDDAGGSGGPQGPRLWIQGWRHLPQHHRMASSTPAVASPIFLRHHRRAPTPPLDLQHASLLGTPSPAALFYSPAAANYRYLFPGSLVLSVLSPSPSLSLPLNAAYDASASRSGVGPMSRSG